MKIALLVLWAGLAAAVFFLADPHDRASVLLLGLAFGGVVGTMVLFVVDRLMAAIYYDESEWD